MRRAIFAYNHADWYVDSVMLRARLIAGVPADLVGSLTGLTEGRFPVAARARYADDLQEKAATKRVKAGENAANVVEDDDNRSAVEIFADEDSPVVATNDGVVKKIGETKTRGRYMVLQDVYGNRYMYAGLGTVSQLLPGAEERPLRLQDQAEGGAREGRPAARRARVEGQPAAQAGEGREPRRRARRARPP